MSYSLVTEKRFEPVNGILRPTEVEVKRLDPVSPEIEALASCLFDVTSRMRGSLMVSFWAQPDEVRDYHHELAKAAIAHLNPS
jgi:hypothetical protein